MREKTVREKTVGDRTVGEKAVGEKAAGEKPVVRTGYRTQVLGLGGCLGLQGVLWWWWSAAGVERLGQFGTLLYWWMPLCLAVAGVCFGWRFLARESGVAERLRVWWPGLVLAVVATGIVFWAVAPQMRVQFDETSLVGVSQNMHQQRQAILTTGAVPFEGRAFPLENMVDKRPPLFAFLVSVVHDLTGYRVANAFYVNGALLALGLFALFAATRARLGGWAACCAPLAVLAVPLTFVVATSAGFELLATVLLLLATVAALAFIERPGHGRCAAFLGCGVLLMQARYESIAAFGLLLAMAAWLVRRSYRPSRGIWLVLAMLPVLATPLLFLMQHAQDPNFTPEAGGQSLVGFSHLVEHTWPFVAEFFSLDVFAVLPGLVGGVGILLFVFGRSNRATPRTLWLAVLPTVLLTLLVLCWFYGNAREQTAVRLFLPASWLVVLGWVASPGGRSRRLGQALCALLALVAGFKLWAVRSGRTFPELPVASLTRELDRIVERLARLPADREATLWVGTPAQHMIIKGHAAVSVRTFRRLIESGRLPPRQHLRTVYILETPLDAAMGPEFGKPRDLLQRIPSEVVERVGGQMPITVHRLRR